MVTAIRPTVSLSTFGEFVVAGSAAKALAVKSALELYGREYNPKLDFYRPWRDAVQLGLLTGDDELALRRADAGAGPVQRKHFEELSTGWRSLRQRYELAVAGQGPRIWSHALCDVRARPHARLIEGDRLRHVALYLKQPPLTRDAARAMAQILNQTVPGTYGVLDVRRAKLWKPQARNSAGFYAWLDGEASSFATMWQQLRRSA